MHLGLRHVPGKGDDLRPEALAMDDGAYLFDGNAGGAFVRGLRGIDWDHCY